MVSKINNFNAFFLLYTIEFDLCPTILIKIVLVNVLID